MPTSPPAHLGRSFCDANIVRCARYGSLGETVFDNKIYCDRDLNKHLRNLCMAFLKTVCVITITQLLTKFENKTKNFAFKAVEDYTELSLLKRL